MDQQCALTKNASGILGCIRQSTAKVREGDPLFSTAETYLEYLGQLWIPQSERNEHAGVSPEKGHEGD